MSDELDYKKLSEALIKMEINRNYVSANSIMISTNQYKHLLEQMRILKEQRLLETSPLYRALVGKDK